MDIKNTIIVNVEHIKANPFQPRQDFDDEGLQELCESIKTHGLIQPILVRKSNDAHLLIAGERRLRAAKLAGLTEIPAIEIEIDGGVGPTNAHLVREAGANILVAGSAVYGTDDYKKAIDSIRGE